MFLTVIELSFRRLSISVSFRVPNRKNLDTPCSGSVHLIPVGTFLHYEFITPFPSHPVKIKWLDTRLSKGRPLELGNPLSRVRWNSIAQDWNNVITISEIENWGNLGITGREDENSWTIIGDYNLIEAENYRQRFWWEFRKSN